MKKEKPVEILNTMLSHQYLDLAKNDFAENLNLPTTVVDFDLVHQNMGGNEELMQAMLQTFLQSLPDEMSKLKQCFTSEDWYALKSTVHQLKGGASYCGTLRLTQVCSRLEESILNSSKKTIANLYEQLLMEIIKVKDTLQSYLETISSANTN